MTVWIARTELKRLFEVGQRRLRLSQCLQREAKLNHRTRKIAVERDRLFEMDLRFDMSTLKSAKPPDRIERTFVIAFAFKDFNEQ